MVFRRQLWLVAVATIGLLIAGPGMATAANPYNAYGYMNKSGDYAGVYVVNAGAGILRVDATLIYTPPGAGATTYTSGIRTDTTVHPNQPVTSGWPATGGTYTVVTKFRGCSGSSSCRVGAWDTVASAHVFA